MKILTLDCIVIVAYGYHNKSYMGAATLFITEFMLKIDMQLSGLHSNNINYIFHL